RPTRTSLPWQPWLYLLPSAMLTMLDDFRSGRFLERSGMLDDPENVALLHDQQLLAVDLDLGAGPFAEQDAITGFHIERDEFTLLVAGTWASRDDLALLRLLLGGVGNDDAAGRLLLGIEAAHDDTVMEWAEMHAILLAQVSD